MISDIKFWGLHLWPKLGLTQKSLNMEFLKQYFNFHLIRKIEIMSYLCDFKSEELKGNPENNHIFYFTYMKENSDNTIFVFSHGAQFWLILKLLLLVHTNILVAWANFQLVVLDLCCYVVVLKKHLLK